MELYFLMRPTNIFDAFRIAIFRSQVEIVEDDPKKDEVVTLAAALSEPVHVTKFMKKWIGPCSRDPDWEAERDQLCE